MDNDFVGLRFPTLLFSSVFGSMCLCDIHESDIFISNYLKKKKSNIVILMLLNFSRCPRESEEAD